MTINDYFGPRFGFGWLIALIVLIVCIVLMVISKASTELYLIAALALARLT